jgi:uncharacterized iron-regulated membrane protein
MEGAAIRAVLEAMLGVARIAVVLVLCLFRLLFAGIAMWKDHRSKQTAGVAPAAKSPEPAGVSVRAANVEAVEKSN